MRIPGLCIWCLGEEPPCSELCFCSEFDQKSDRSWLKKPKKLMAGWDEKQPEFLFFINKSWDSGPDSPLVFNSVLLYGSCKKCPHYFFNLRSWALDYFSCLVEVAWGAALSQLLVKDAPLSPCRPIRTDAMRTCFSAKLSSLAKTTLVSSLS